MRKKFTVWLNRGLGGWLHFFREMKFVEPGVAHPRSENEMSELVLEAFGAIAQRTTRAHAFY